MSSRQLVLLVVNSWVSASVSVKFLMMALILADTLGFSRFLSCSDKVRERVVFMYAIVAYKVWRRVWDFLGGWRARSDPRRAKG